MSATTLTGTSQQSQAIPSLRGLRPLLSVMTWEFRRFGASRLFWLQALGFFCFSLFATWALHAPVRFSVGLLTGNRQFVTGFVAGTSTWGLLLNLPIVLMVLVLLLPFVSADGVTRDVNRRTHELLMTTALPTWAYVWGRFLVGLVMSLGLALLMLVSLLGMGWLLHMTISAYPLPHISSVVLLWVGMVVPATILVSSLGFALSTLFPRSSTLVKVVILVTWIVGALVLQSWPRWYVNWDPTSRITATGLLRSYSMNLGPTIKNEVQFQQLILSIENKMPDLSGWFAPHLLLGGLSLLFVLIAALAFKRSRDMLS